MKTILLADDELHIRTLVRTTLVDPGYRIIEATDGVEAVDHARAHQPDLLVLDLMMPRMTGIEVARILRREPALAHVPIIILTAVNDDRELEAARNAGVTSYLVKPFSPLELLDIVETLLGSRYVA